ncbi:MAG TPA: hypothetical protein VMT52_09610 [Planctomycetota bacterium]|nr:hypothetical protein [Planctomycetota bacterium]
MSPTDYILISVTAIGFLLLFGLSIRPHPERKEPPKEATRWKRFRIIPAALHGALAEAAAVVSEEPAGLKLTALPRDGGARGRIRIASDSGSIVLVIARGWFLSRTLRVQVDGNELFCVAPPRGPKGQVEVQFTPPLGPLDLAGSLLKREYEIRRQGNLIAMVSWQRRGGDKAVKEDYILESLKGEDAMPLLALTLAIEAAQDPPQTQGPLR